MLRKKIEPHPLIQNYFFLKNERDWSHCFLDYDIILNKELLGCLDIGYIKFQTIEAYHLVLSTAHIEQCFFQHHCFEEELAIIEKPIVIIALYIFINDHKSETVCIFLRSG